MKLISKIKLGIATAFIAAGIIGTIQVKQNLGNSFLRPPTSIQALNQNYPLTMKYVENQEPDYKTKLNLKIDIDTEENVLYLGNYTQNYDKQDWPDSERFLPPYVKHTRIHPISKTFLLHSPLVEISKVKQRAYLVPQYGWDQDLKPFEKHEEAQKIIQGGEKLLDAVTGMVPIPYFKEFFDGWLKYVERKDKRLMEEMVSKIRGDYAVTIIPSHEKSKLLSSIITARESKIFFDVNEFEKLLPLYLVTRITLGDCSATSYGSFPNKCGTIEKIIKFNLEGKILDESGSKGRSNILEQLPTRKEVESKKIESQKQIIKKSKLKDYFNKGKERVKQIISPKLKLEDYFLQGNELNNIKMWEESPYKNIAKQGEEPIMVGNFRFLAKGNFSRSQSGEHYIMQCKNEKEAQNKGTHSPKFWKENIITWFGGNLISDIALGINGRFSKEQKIEYIKLLLNYQKRTGMKLVLDRRPEQNQYLIEFWTDYLKKHSN